MNREDLRLVEFTVVEKTKAKKGKKTTKKEVKKYGYFHLWGTNVNGKGNEKFFGLIEEAVSGSLLEITYKDIRFLSEAEVEEYHEAAEVVAEENAETVAIVEEIIAEAEEATETPAQEAPAEEAKPKTTRSRKKS
ncbi:hypothetical protein AM493_12895 [Flavobacterium akiainvivens]|uniref:Uncharacterized protein n=1 Tax=Flavobacterium akiainvivens TaxID=1202724 RepID=A0A0M8MIC0_9FLAO|nr:hypothetical protein [Flavobacterium akiainvivens]KOS06821.1 hypothetical protein AM493_12895 [Flavobacterium akiainvivens]SFQ75201.1 hypothetical protein SAMN05444144_12129 [Flavobacterium akiainvivens]